MTTKPHTELFRFILVVVIAGVISMAINGCSATATKESTGQYIDDAAISTKIKAKFLENPQVSGLRIGVETYKGVVQLSGFANSSAEIERAGELANDTAGVRSVSNNIQLKH